jgi:hypothetical protein
MNKIKFIYIFGIVSMTKQDDKLKYLGNIVIVIQ